MLELRDVKVAYGDILALRGVSLSVDAGEAVAVIGSNGAGKSTMLRAISGLHRAAEGAITFEGTAITRASTDRIVELGISQCPEGRHVFGRLSVRENLVLGGKARALLQGRSHVTAEDIKALAVPVLRHRILVNYRAEAEGVNVENIIERLVGTR